MNPSPKRRPLGRLPQMNKALRLRRRSLGQWSPAPQQVAVADTVMRNLDWSPWQ